MTTSRLTPLTDRVQRIDYCGMCVDLILTSKGTVRVGSMPDIAKFLTEHGFREEIVVVPDWEVSITGDNRTGEEFILWQAQIRGGLTKEYVGLHHNIEQLHRHLKKIFPYFFDEKRLSIVRKDWLNDWFKPVAVDSVYQNGELEIQFSDESIVIVDEGKRLYDSSKVRLSRNIEKDIETVLATIPRDTSFHESLEVIPIGCGNGIYGTVANAIVRYGDTVIWIDPCGYPAHTLARQNIHWDDVTHFLFTHNHEDHVQGFTACLQRARLQKKTMNLLVADSVFRILEQLYTPLFPELTDHVEVTSLTPGTPLNIGALTVESRWNHHILPYGTVGLKISAGGKSFGYSGDTKYDETINSIIKRAELKASWFEECDLVFHEIEFDNPNSVHTHWKQVEALQRSISGKVLGYHTPFLANSPFELAKEGQLYLV